MSIGPRQQQIMFYMARIYPKALPNFRVIYDVLVDPHCDHPVQGEREATGLLEGKAKITKYKCHCWMNRRDALRILRGLKKRGMVDNDGAQWTLTTKGWEIMNVSPSFPVTVKSFMPIEYEVRFSHSPALKPVFAAFRDKPRDSDKFTVVKYARSRTRHLGYEGNPLCGAHSPTGRSLSIVNGSVNCQRCMRLNEWRKRK